MKVIKRWWFIWTVITQYKLYELLPKLHTKLLVRCVLWLTPSTHHKATTDEAYYVRLRLALEALGPIFVKLGQTLSTRPDLLPPELAKELAKLQDKAQPFSTKTSVGIIESAFGMTVQEAFFTFDESVLASASIAQVHTAKLKSGEDVIIKVVRPGIDEVIERDLQSMRIIAKFIHGTVGDLRQIRLPEFVEEFAHSIHNELDLRQEAANASKLRANFPNHDFIYIPKVYWKFVSENVMVMERIFATPISDMETLHANNVDMKKLAERGIEIFFTQAFHHKYFHADMHPGNILVDISEPSDPKYKIIDFGIMGTLSDENQYYLAENFLAFFNRDYYRVAKLHIDSGWVPKSVNAIEFETALRKVGEPVLGKPLEEISFGEFLIALVKVARQFEMTIQPQLLLLQKTVLNVEGLGRILYPKLDIWETAKPILENWTKDQFNPKEILKQLKKHAVDYRNVLPKIPLFIDQQLANETNQTSSPKKPSSDSKTSWAILLGALLIIGVLPQLWHESIIRPLAISAAFIVGLRLFFSKN